MRAPSSAATSRERPYADASSAGSPRSPPRQTGPTACTTQRAASRPAVVALASPVSQPPSRRHSASISVPPARWIAPSTPPPPRSDSFAAFTIASTCCAREVSDDEGQSTHSQGPFITSASEPIGRTVSESPEIPYRRIGTILVEWSLITEGQLAQALAEQEETGRLLGEVLVSSYGISRLDLADALAEQWQEANRAATAVTEQMATQPSEARDAGEAPPARGTRGGRPARAARRGRSGSNRAHPPHRGAGQAARDARDPRRRRHRGARGAAIGARSRPGDDVPFDSAPDAQPRRREIAAKSRVARDRPQLRAASSSPTVSPAGRLRTLSSARSTPGTKASREIAS